MSSVDLTQLRYYVQAIKDGNMSVAAEHLFVSRQALSKSIRLLEETTGITLLERSKAGVVPTEFGKTFYKSACEVLREVDHLNQMCDLHRQGIDDTVRMGIIADGLATNGGTIRSEDLLSFQQQHPRISCIFEDVVDENIETEVGEKDIDLAITISDFDRARFGHALLLNYPIAIIVSSRNPLARRESVSLDDLADKEVEINTAYRDNFLRMCNQYDFHPRLSPLQTTHNWDAQAVHDSDIIIVHALRHARFAFSSAVESDLLAIVPIVQDGKPVTHPLYLIWRKDDMPRGAHRDLRDYIIRLYKREHPHQ